MTVQSQYIPLDLIPEIEDLIWFVCWCSSCKAVWLMCAMQELVACPYCRTEIEPSTTLFMEGEFPDEVA